MPRKAFLSFALAQIECTYPDGERATFDWEGQPYERMIPDYGRDGRHLNELGRRRVAGELIALLSQTPVSFSDTFKVLHENGVLPASLFAKAIFCILTAIFF